MSKVSPLFISFLFLSITRRKFIICQRYPPSLYPSCFCLSLEGSLLYVKGIPLSLYPSCSCLSLEGSLLYVKGIPPLYILPVLVYH